MLILMKVLIEYFYSTYTNLFIETFLNYNCHIQFPFTENRKNLTLKEFLTF